MTTDEPTDDPGPDPDADVLVELTSYHDVTYRHVVSTRVTRAEWRDLDESERADAVNEAVSQHVEATVLDEPSDDPPYEPGD